MDIIGAKRQNIPATIQAIGACTLALILVALVVRSVMAADQPVPVEVQGCYRSGDQILEVHAREIIVNDRSVPKVAVEYTVTNMGPTIVTVDETHLELDQARSPHLQVGRNTTIDVHNDRLVAYTDQADAIDFVKIERSANCRAVSNGRLPD